MAVQIPAPLFNPLTLTTGNTTLYTAPAAPTTLVVRNVRFRFTNISGSSHSVTAYAVPSGSSAGSTNMVLNAEGIAGNAHMDVDMPAIAAGGFYVAFADTLTSINAEELTAVIFT